MTDIEPDVLLAQCDGNTWLVRGDEHMHDLLRATLPADVSVGFVACDSLAHAHALWAAARPAGPADDGADGPWMIHPGIAARLRAALGPPVIEFAPWSAMLGPAAHDVLRAAAARLAADPGARLVLRQFHSAVVVPGRIELQALRGQLAVAALSAAGAAADRIGHETAAAGEPDQEDRLELVNVGSAAP